MRAITYARFSTDQQTESSITDQFRVCRQHAEQRGWQVAAEHSDEGISGAALGNRPGVQATLADLNSGDVLLLVDLSRLSRSQDLAPLLLRLRHRGVRVIGVQDGFDSDSRTARMQAGLSGIMSEEFRTMVADRTRSALELRARTGGATGGKAYGNREIVVEMFTRFAAGETMKAIVSDLNARGVPSPGASWKPRANTRGRWLVSALHAILRNEKYVGREVWNRSQWVKDPDSGRRVRRERPQSEWIVRECEPLIDRATWDAVQRRFAVRDRRSGRGGGRPTYLLSGLLECGLCGSKLIVMGSGKGRYACNANRGGGAYACSNRVSVPRVLAEEAILGPILAEMLSPAAVTEGVRMLREERATAERTVGRAGDPAERELAELERLVREGVVSAAVMAPAIVEARKKVKAARDNPVATGYPWPSEKLWREVVEGMRDILTGEDVQAARDVLKRLVGKVRCTPSDGGMDAEVHWYHLLLATGASRGVSNGSGGVLRLGLPTSSRRPASTEVAKSTRST